MLPRKLQRCVIDTSIIATVLVTLVFIVPWNRWSVRDSFNNEDSDFYHFYEVADAKKLSVVKYSDMGWLKDGRRRTLNTSEGLVTVKDMLLVPKNPLPNGANLYKSIDDGGNRLHLNDIDSSPRGLDNFEEEIAMSMQSVRRRDTKNGNCTALPCAEFLSDQDTPHFQHCSKMSRIDEEPPATMCSFRLPNPSLPLVALASSPGSGVDLLRWFLQELTGVCTGSLRCNTNLRRAGYAGESVRTTAVLGVAMDSTDPLWRPLSHDETVPQEPHKSSQNGEVNINDDVPAFDSAVYLLRNPFDAILEEWSNSELGWESFVCDQALSWQQMVESWLVHNKNHSVMIVRYEELESRTRKELLKIMKFLDVPYSVTKLVGVQWTGVGGEMTRGIDAFKADHVECVNSAIAKAAETLSAHTWTRNIDLTLYHHKFN